MCSFLHPPVTSSLLGPHVFLGRLLSNILNMYPSRNVRDQVPRPYKIFFFNFNIHILHIRNCQQPITNKLYPLKC